MASSIIHLAIAEELMKRRSFISAERLRFGVVLPDAGDGARSRSHLRIQIDERGRRTYDLERFRAMYGARMQRDDLYLGYYLHLIQDIVFRQFIYQRYHWNPNVPDGVNKLHRDYAISNRYVIERYAMINNVVIPEGFEREPIHALCPFNAEGLIGDIHGYFASREAGTPFFFTAAMADEYIADATHICLRELRALEQGEALMDSAQNAWGGA